MTVCSVSRRSMKGKLDCSSCGAPLRSSLNRTPRASKRSAKQDCELSCGFLATQATNCRSRLRAASS
eukprot:3596345-Pleurochrysis_carterae.AAC.1